MIDPTLSIKLSAAEFAMWELHLYLDTHPTDLQTLALYNKYQSKCELLRSEYEEKYGALFASDAQGVEWFKSPWPWDTEECDC